jgi:plastocyanin
MVTRLVLVAASLTLLAGCGSGSQALGAPKPPPTTAEVPVPTPTPAADPLATSIRHNIFDPNTLSVPTGATIKIHNYDSVAHNLADQKHHLYDGDIPAKGRGELTTPPTAGTYVFTDKRHPGLKLTVKVH